MSWTDERIDLLKKRWSEGLSASQIATELGGVSRNAVIGKVHRLKLESRIKAPQPMAEAPQPTPLPKRAPQIEAVVAAPSGPRLVTPSQPTAAATASRPMAHSLGATALKMEPLPDYTVQPVEEEKEAERQSAEIVPISRNLTLIQLSERTCKWPLGDPLSPEFRFCGNHSGDASPYCRYHARIAFQPVSERRRVR